MLLDNRVHQLLSAGRMRIYRAAIAAMFACALTLIMCISIAPCASGSVFVKMFDPATGLLRYKGMVTSSVFVVSGPKDDKVVGSAKNVVGVFYQNGKPAARLIAKQANADSVAQTVVASGDVVVISLLQPGTTLRCDKLTYYCRTQQMHGLGHVVMVAPHYRAASKSFAANVTLKGLRAPDPTLPATPANGIRLDFWTIAPKGK